MQRVFIVIWIIALAVWTFLAGAFFNIGWVQSAGYNYDLNFITGGLAMILVLGFLGWGLFRFAKNVHFKLPARLALGVVTFFTAIFYGIGMMKYDKIQDMKHGEYFDFDKEMMEVMKEIHEMEKRIDTL